MHSTQEIHNGRTWRVAGGLFVGLILAVWAYGDRRLDELHTSGGMLTIGLLGALLVLTVLGKACARQWQRAAHARSEKTRLSLAAGSIFLVGLWVAFAVFTLIPDVLTLKDHPNWTTALVAAAWRATAWTCASFVGYGISRLHAH